MALATESLSLINSNNNPLEGDLDLNAYFNFDQSSSGLFASPSPSSADGPPSVIAHSLQQSNSVPPQSLIPSETVPGLSPDSLDASNFAHGEIQHHHHHHHQQQGQEQFPIAPSHEYDQFKQQTGLPPGSLANTIPMSQHYPSLMSPVPGLDHDPSVFGVSYGLPFDQYQVPQSSTLDASLDSSFPMIPEPSPFYPTFPHADGFSGDSQFRGYGSSGRPGQYVNQSLIDNYSNNSQEEPDEASKSSASTRPRRVYPGIHKQQAAKEAQNQKRQGDMIRRYHQAQEQAKAKAHTQAQTQSKSAPSMQFVDQFQGQSQVQTQPPQNIDSVSPSSEDTASSSSNLSDQHNDASVGKRIDEVLQQMKKASIEATRTALATELPSSVPSSQINRARKDEEEMDEDERLLVSAEGKKLTSKERRQLRNKVSARAFRSRRKEYIGQLEGEVAAATGEVSELRVHNRTLIDENTRLSNLVRVLLSSSPSALSLPQLNVHNAPFTTQASDQSHAQQHQQQRSQLHSTQVSPSNTTEATVVSTSEESRVGSQDGQTSRLMVSPELSRGISASSGILPSQHERENESQAHNLGAIKTERINV